MILITKKPSTNNKSDNKLRTIRELSTNKLRIINKSKAINRSGTMIPSTDSRPRAMNLTSNTKRIDPK